MNRRAAIITSYIDTPFPMKDDAESMDIIICTDGGYDLASEQKIRPNFLLGDLDSITSPIPEDIPVIRFNPEKDYTDLQLSIEKALEIGASDIEIWGGIGGRLDHTIANIQLLSNYSEKCQRLILRDGANEAMILSAGTVHKIEARDGWYFSLFSLSDTCQDLKIEGAKYNVDNFTLTRNYPIAVSNEFASDMVSITVSGGTLLLVLASK